MPTLAEHNESMFIPSRGFDNDIIGRAVLERQTSSISPISSTNSIGSPKSSHILRNDDDADTHEHSDDINDAKNPNNPNPVIVNAANLFPISSQPSSNHNINDAKKKHSFTVTTRRRRPTFSPSNGGGIENDCNHVNRKNDSDNNNKKHMARKSVMDPHHASSSSSSSSKRSKLDIPSILSYPPLIPVPSKCTIAALYESALQDASAATARSNSKSQNKLQKTDNNKNSNSNNNNNNNNALSLGGEMVEDATVVSSSSDFFSHHHEQLYLKPAGLLSLEEVLLPALALQEERALKKLQSKVQRDLPRYKWLLEDSRRKVRHAIGQAIDAVQKSRGQRHDHQRQRRKEQAEERRRQRQIENEKKVLQRQLELQERQKQKEVERKERKKQMQRKHPRNQELWREVVFLTSSITQLEKEERMWIQAEQDLIVRHELQQKEDAAKQQQQGKGDEETTSRTTSEQLGDVPSNSLVTSTTTDTSNAIQDIVLASTRIQQGLTMILQSMEESEKLQKDLYQHYRKDHQFNGYKGVRNPKALIRFLSQEDD